MGGIVLCHKKKAKKPYEVNRVHHKIYTMEELCYYICNHLYLIDYTFMNEELCEWLENELDFKILARQLRKILEQHGSTELFIVKILEASSIYTAEEFQEIQNVLEKLKNQKPIEKQKYKADSLMESDAIQSAILVYQSILKDKDDSVEKKFYGKVYACLGSAYGRMFLYEEAANMYKKALLLCEDDSILQAYLYACQQYMSETEYQTCLQKSQRYQKCDVMVKDRIKEIKQNLAFCLEQDTLEKWKDKYRMTGMGEL